MVKLKDPEELRDMFANTPMENRRIFSIVAHIHHGKTSITDYLLSKAGLMADTEAGRKLLTNWDAIEKERKLTIFGSVINLGFEYDGKAYLLEVNDTPGHISWTGEVSRALRCSDGVVLVVCAVEGILTQTETNIRLSVGAEGCKPVLFINKADRLISELRLSPKAAYERLDTIIRGVNDYIRRVAPPQFAEEWTSNFKEGTVAVGSAKDGWAFTFPVLKRKNITPEIVFEKYAEGDKEWLRKTLPLHEAMLEMVINHLPDPETGQKNKIPSIWKGDLDSEVGKALLDTDPNGDLLGVIAKVVMDPKRLRAFLVGRVFSGTLKAGQEVRLLTRKSVQRVKRVGVQEVTDILDMPEIKAGNMFSIYGFICPAGESFSDSNIELAPFEQIKYAVEPVVSRTIEAANPQDIAKLDEIVKMWTLADPTLLFTFDKETKKTIISGIDPLQLEVLARRINDHVPINMSEPVVVFREKVEQRGQEFHTKSSNGHNKIKGYVEPLDEKTLELIKTRKVTADQPEKERARILKEEAGWNMKEARNIWDIYKNNVIVNMTAGVQRLDRLKQAIINVINDFVEGGPLAREPVMGLKIVITDCFVHEDPAHTGYSEVFTMTSSALNMSFLTAEPRLYEPVVRVDMRLPIHMMGEATKLISGHRGQVIDVRQLEKEGEAIVTGLIPTIETMDLADELRNATEGRGVLGYEFDSFKPVPSALAEEYIKEIRQRKNLPAAIPKPENWRRFLYIRSK